MHYLVTLMARQHYQHTASILSRKATAKLQIKETVLTHNVAAVTKNALLSEHEFITKKDALSTLLLVLSHTTFCRLSWDCLYRLSVHLKRFVSAL